MISTYKALYFFFLSSTFQKYFILDTLYNLYDIIAGSDGIQKDMKLLEKDEKVELNKTLEEEKRDTFNDTVPDNRQYQQR